MNGNDTEQIVCEVETTAAKIEQIKVQKFTLVTLNVQI